MIDDEVSLSGPSTGLNGTPQPSGPSQGGNVQPTTPGTDFNNVVVGMAPGSNGAGQNQSSGSSNGWSRNGDNWYYIDPSTGKMVKGWKKIDGYWYYLDSDSGVMVTGWKLHNGEWYYLYNTGVMAHGGWLLIDDKWYCFRNDSGELERGKILEYDGKKYYVNDDGVMVTRSECETVEYRGVIYEVDWDGVCTAISVERPVGADQAEWKAFIESTPEISEKRRTILLAAFATLERNCYYHQIRFSSNKPHEKCTDGCDKAIHPRQGKKESYDFSTMAAYNAAKPIYLDCSYFVKHCYWKAGIEMSASNTSGMFEENATQWETFIDKTLLRPTDIAVERHENDNGGWSGHVVMFLGFTRNSNEMVWIEMSNHKSDGIVSAYDPKRKRIEYIYRKWNGESLD